MSSPQSGPLPALAAVWRRRGHWRDIRFKAELERFFRDTKLERRRPLLAAGLVTAALLQVVFVALDYLWLGHHLAPGQAVTLLLAVAVPQLVFAATLPQRLQPVYLQWAVLALVAWTALAFSVLLATLPASGGRPPFAWEATITLVIFACLFTGLRFFHVLTLCGAVFVLYLASQLWAANEARPLLYALYFLGAITLLALIGEYLLERAERYEFLFRRRLHRHMERDFLTGLANRRTLYRSLKLALDMGRRDRRSVAVAMIDVDDFKSFNDKYGHLGGDRNLRRLAAVLRQLVNRPLDCAARYAGDEFCVVWYDVADNGADILARRIHRMLADAGLPLTVSVGSVLITPDRFDGRGSINRNTADLVLEYADTRLYRAKLARSRNHTVVGGATLPGEVRHADVQSS